MLRGQPVSGSPRAAMSDGYLSERVAADGATVRIRRTSVAGVSPVVAVLERLAVAHAIAERVGVEQGDHAPGPLSLLEVMAETELDVLLLLEPYARSEAAVERLARTRE